MKRTVALAMLPLLMIGACDDPASAPPDWYATNQVGYFDLTRTTNLYRDSTTTEDVAYAWFQSPDSIGISAGKVTINGTEIPLRHADPVSGSPATFYRLASGTGAPAVPLELGGARHQFEAGGSTSVPALSAAEYSPAELVIRAPLVTDTVSRAAGFAIEQRFAEAPVMPLLHVRVIALGDPATIGTHVIEKEYVESPTLAIRITPEELRSFPAGPIGIAVRRTRELQAQTTAGRLFRTTISSAVSWVVQMKE